MYTLWLETADELGEVIVGGHNFILNLFQRLKGAKYVIHQCGHVPALKSDHGRTYFYCDYCGTGGSDDSHG